MHKNRTEELLERGEHFDDCSFPLMSAGTSSSELPRTSILSQVQMFSYERRPIKKSKLK